MTRSSLHSRGVHPTRLQYRSGDRTRRPVTRRSYSGKVTGTRDFGTSTSHPQDSLPPDRSRVHWDDIRWTMGTDPVSLVPLLPPLASPRRRRRSDACPDSRRVLRVASSRAEPVPHPTLHTHTCTPTNLHGYRSTLNPLGPPPRDRVWTGGRGPRTPGTRSGLEVTTFLMSRSRTSTTTCYFYCYPTH